MNDETPRASFIQKTKRVISSFGTTERVVFGACGVIFIISALYILNTISQKYMTEVPVDGGTLNEGIIGYASSINPVLAYTDADKDLSSLIYSGLLRATPTGLAPDLASSWTVSPDGLTYDVTIRSDAVFQDGTPVTADDVIFTINKVLDPTINSPKAANWAGVTVTKVNSKELTFTLTAPYPGFDENLTLGILPAEKWQDIDPALFSRSTLNQEPIGSGPYEIKSTEKNSDGLYEYYDLVPFSRYTLGKPHISHIIIRFYKNEDDAVAAYKNGSISALGGISPDSAVALQASGARILQIALPRTFAIFFNQSNAPVLLNSEVRQALNMAVDRKALIQDVLKGYGSEETGPIPQDFADEESLTASTTATSTDDHAAALAAAKQLLANKGWKPGPDGILQKQTKDSKNNITTTALRFSISTSNVPELKRTAELVAEDWKALGADVTIQIFEPSDLSQKVIQPRQYDALLFGTAIGRDLDLYPFWNSSQRTYPGLNIAQYANLKADAFLQTARGSASSTVRDQAYQGFENQVANDIPAVFLYSPQYIYVVPKQLQNIQISGMTAPFERFMNIYQWNRETEKIWNIFIRK